MAREYMQAHVDETITVPDLCLATGVSRRTLQYAIEDVMRLSRVRCELQARMQDTIGDVAARWGFWHLSRFYERLFGELPFVTRARWFAKSG